MTHRPANVDDLRKLVSQANSSGRRIDGIDLSAVNQVLDFAPEDMTVTVQAGITLAALQSRLCERRQWLPLDPPNPEKLTVGEMIDGNISGPRRFGWGTVRDHMLGLKAVMADGAIVSSGSRVVKNVAGFDLQKLFIGGRGTLGVVVEATFKLQPVTEKEGFVQKLCPSADAAARVIDAALDSRMAPSVLDMHNIGLSSGPDVLVVLGFMGAGEEVEWQISIARELGFSEPSTLDYEKSFRAGAPGDMGTISVLPSKLPETVQALGAVPFVARAGNGVIYHRGGKPPKTGQPEAAQQLMRRVKAAFDPKGIFPALQI